MFQEAGPLAQPLLSVLSEPGNNQGRGERTVETGNAGATCNPARPQVWFAGREKAIICRSGPAEALDRLLLRFSGEMEIEHVPTLAEGMQRCIASKVDILLINLFTFTARELTALAAFRSMTPKQRVIILTDPVMKPVLDGADLADEIIEVSEYAAERGRHLPA